MNDVKYPEMVPGWTIETSKDGDVILRHPKHGAGMYCRDDVSARVEVAAHFLRDLVATCALRGAQIPDGWKLIPFKPTEDMCRAAVVFANGSAVYKNLPAAVLEIEEGIYGEVFEAMLSAAPKPNSYGCTCQSGKCPHASSCAVHNAPAYLPGPCDCGVISPPTPEGEAK